MGVISITVTGGDSSILFIEKKARQLNNAVIRLGKLTRDRFHNEIKSRTKRKGATGRLISSIRIEVIRPSKEKTEVGIGNKDTMTKEAKYWYVVNYGAKVSGEKFIPPANKGSFNGGPPRQGTDMTQRWGHHDAGWWMKPRRFRPMNYIGRTNSWLLNYYQEFISRAIQ